MAKPWAIGMLAIILSIPACEKPEPVDPELIGRWVMQQPDGRLELEISADGRYRLHHPAATGTPDRQGNMYALNHVWRLQSPHDDINAQGHYSIKDGVLTVDTAQRQERWLRLSASAMEIQSGPAADITSSTHPRPDPKAADIPETIDPCKLVTEAEAETLLRWQIVTRQTTPQPQTQNDCHYQDAGDYRNQLNISTYNGRGLRVAARIESLKRKGWQALADTGDAAFFRLNDQISPPSISVIFFIGTAQGSITLSGPPAGSLPDLARRMSAAAARRMSGPASAFTDPGLSAFAGNWLMRSRSTSGPNKNAKMFAQIEADGAFRLTGVSAVSGAIQAEAGRYSVKDICARRFIPLAGCRSKGNLSSGHYRVSGDELTLTGDVSGRLSRVACGKEADLPVPYEMIGNYAGSLSGRPLSTVASGGNPTGGYLKSAIDKLGYSVDARLLGLWAGTGELHDATPAGILWSVTGDGLATLVTLPRWDFQLSAANGVYKLTASRAGGDRQGRYRLGGGIQSGTLFMKDETGEWALQRTEPHARKPGSIAVTGHC